VVGAGSADEAGGAGEGAEVDGGETVVVTASSYR
jgi:hypothetical protein